MKTETSISKKLTGLDQQKAYDLFDSLEPIKPDFLLGRWKGGEVTTGHDMDGMLGATGWYGKVFESTERVHPLVFYGDNKTLFAVNPGMMPLGLASVLPKWSALKHLITTMRFMVGTKEPKAKIREVEFRGKVSSAMVYDQLPITDHFRRLDDETVLGLMQREGDPLNYCFYLQKDDTPMQCDF